jgi:YtoQ family protein
MKQWVIYLSGEIHSDWRQQIEQGCQSLPVLFTSPVTDHEASDAAGDHLGHTEDTFWRDHQSSKVNAIRTQTLIQHCDLAVIRFGDKYKQWNAAFDAGYCAALAKPYITLHDDNIVHPLKEVDAMALAWAKTPNDVIKVIEYIVK